jgi:hypothetical protein
VARVPSEHGSQDALLFGSMDVDTKDLFCDLAGEIVEPQQEGEDEDAHKRKIENVKERLQSNRTSVIKQMDRFAKKARLHKDK